MVQGARLMTDPRTIEAVARAIYEQDDENDRKNDRGSVTLGKWEDFPPLWKEEYEMMAKAAIAAHEKESADE